ncbi:MAG: sugar ABC transporter ATP-binding protein [Lachnospiraceae bacterium]|nr:sugar ABC transporter ATP-binding protein [Lachnospiraceae bacterium]MCI8958703.1 sugar ABC transporter ATP-binding protein [Lachnospiraceae bacterium]
MADYIIEMQHITKEFFGVKALDDVNLAVRRGEIHAICGENGAGKSTLMNILSGIYPYGTYSGDILYDGQVCRFSGLKDSEKKGIVIIHQELALIPGISAAENLFLGNERQEHGIISWNRTNYEAKQYLNRVGFKYQPEIHVKDIGIGAQQLLEIAKAIAKNVRLLILDEPTASLPEQDATHLLNLLKEFREEGITCVIISHKLNEICSVADRITIIRDGRTVALMEEDLKPFDESRIVKHMVGRDMEDRFPSRSREAVRKEVGFEIRDWTTYHPSYYEKKMVDHASLKVHKGEIVGLYGLMGAGRTEMAMSLFGHQYGQRTSGTVLKDGKELHITDPKSAIDQGLAYLSEDRKGLGLIINESIELNTTLAGLDQVTGKWIINRYLEAQVTSQYIELLHTRCNSIAQPVRGLSGGNQQKVAIAKWLFTKADVLILDEPTRGIDVGAKYEIYCLMDKLSREGKSILFISSDLVEILGMSDRIYLMNEGVICGELDGESATQEMIMKQLVTHRREDKK